MPRLVIGTPGRYRLRDFGLGPFVVVEIGAAARTHGRAQPACTAANDAGARPPRVSVGGTR